MANPLNNVGTQITSALKDGRKIPKFGSGARCLIRVAGKSLGLALDFRWSVSHHTTEIRTIDTTLPWDMVPGQTSISASLSQIHDPTNSLEAQALFSTMQSSIHQPYVEIQVLDITGVNIFFARGMFTAMSGNIAHGQLTSVNANFQGVLYQHNVYQTFTPYSAAGDILQSATDLLGVGQQLSGGFL